MRIVLLLLVWGGLLGTVGCHSEAPRQAVPPKAKPLPSTALSGIWQLDYYPDSLLLKKDIYGYSNWTTPYAATLRFAGDSCELIGWHESGWEKFYRVTEGLYRLGDENQYQEIQLETDRLLFREVSVSDSGTTTNSEWYPYHRVAAVLTQEVLARRVARDIFAGRYRVLQSDVKADSTVALSAEFAVQGLPGVAKYAVVTAMDWDFLLPNAFSWQDRQGQTVGRYSFKFAGDTLLLQDFAMRPEDDDVPSGVAVTAIKARLLKLPARGNGPAVAGAPSN